LKALQNGKSYTGALGYGQSKTANILLALALSNRLKDRGVQCYSVHPGSIPTNLLRDIPLEEKVDRGWTDEDGNPINKALTWKTPAQGAATTVVAAFEPSISTKSGAYLLNCQVETNDVAPYALDEESAERLWKLSESLVGQNFEY
jgi:NAD(P)-dependent dehydrogenase (short-subunit alcohol dehydrogenase family)